MVSNCMSLMGEFVDLLVQFISPKANIRTDEYSSREPNALRLLHRIVIAIRAEVPSDFILGVKINAGDYVDTAEGKEEVHETLKTEQEDRALIHVCTIAGWGGVDFIEISGGDYENPEFMTSASSSSVSPRQAFFARFSHRALMVLKESPSSPNSPHPLILLTGGLRTPGHLYTALSYQHAHLLGIGRGAVLCPDLPELLMERERSRYGINGSASNLDAAFKPEPDLDLSASFLGHWPWSWFLSLLPQIRLIGAGVEMAWYVVAIRRLATTRTVQGSVKMNDKVDLDAGHHLGGIGAVVRMWFWVGSMGQGSGGVFFESFHTPRFWILVVGSLIFLAAVMFGQHIYD